MEKIDSSETIAERIEDLTKTEKQSDKLECMRPDMKTKQREDGMINILLRRDKTFPTQFGGYEETPNVKETLRFWGSINIKEVAEG